MSRNFKVSSRLEAMMSRLGFEALMSRLGLGRFGPRSSSGANVCRVIKQFNATGSVTPQRKGKCGRKRFPFFRDDG